MIPDGFEKLSFGPIVIAPGAVETIAAPPIERSAFRGSLFLVTEGAGPDVVIDSLSIAGAEQLAMPGIPSLMFVPPPPVSDRRRRRGPDVADMAIILCVAVRGAVVSIKVRNRGAAPVSFAADLEGGYLK